MPSVFRKSAPQKAAAPAPVDINEMISRLNRQLATAKENEVKQNEQAKTAMKANNPAMARSHLQQVKQFQAQQKTIMSNLGMINMKQNQAQTVQMVRDQISVVGQLNQVLVGENIDTLQDQFQDAMATSNEQSMQVQMMNEQMNQMTEMMLGNADQNNEVDTDMAMLQAQVDAEKMNGITSPQKVPEPQVEKVKPANNMDDLL